MIQNERIEKLNDRPLRPGQYVLYWMQQAQRTEFNHAIEFAIRQANEVRLPLVVAFGLTDVFPEANLRHYTFLLEGLREVHDALKSRDIRMVIRLGAPDRVAVELGKRAALVVTDRGYLRMQKLWRASAARDLACPLYQVESDVVVPVNVASDHEEYAARTLRPKIHRHLDTFLAPLEETRVKQKSLGLDLEGLNPDRLEALLARWKLNRAIAPVTGYRGGPAEARRRLNEFVEQKLAHYPELRNAPGMDQVSNLSPYLHFGQISPLQIILAVRHADAPAAAKDAFIEELIIRRELSMNFVEYNPRYDRYEGLPAWARHTLAIHAKDSREYVYAPADLEKARTHDPYWNAAQMEMVLTGKMHNYMRMYWGKKILEWSASPAAAFKTALRLNNRYELDGRDANSFAGVAWCFGKHDRPWTVRSVFGTIRYMNAAGLDRKFDMADYVRQFEPSGRPPSAQLARGGAKP